MRQSVYSDTRYLMRHGNLRVPCSRYGSDTEACARVAIHALRAYDMAVGETSTLEQLDWMMGLVVNDHDDPEHLILEYGDAQAKATLW